MKIVEVSEDCAGLRLDKFLCYQFDIAFSLAQKLVREKKIKVNGGRVAASYRVDEGDVVKVFSDLKKRFLVKKKKKISEQKITKFWQDVIFENDDFLAINKRPGLAVQGGSGIDVSLDDILKEINKKNDKKLQLVHRLDKDTSGILLIAKGRESANFLVEAFKNKKIKKTYLALVYGVVRRDEGVIDIALRKKFVQKNEKVYPDVEGKEAVTKFRVLRRFKDRTLLELEPLTGRTHQIRVHCKEIGHAILGDVKYGGKKVLLDGVTRMFLCAKKVEFCAFDGKKVVIETDETFV